jgi:excisionase family DNA binding protein
MTKFRLLTTAEVATLTGVSVKTVVRWVAAGELAPMTKLPGIRGAFLFDPKAVERFRAKRGAA